MKSYTAKTPIDYGNGKDKPARRYEIGETIEVDDQTAEQLLAIKAIEPHDRKAAFQDAVKTAEAAARELEQAGGDPSAAHRELHERRESERRALDEAVDAVAVVVRSGVLQLDDAVGQVSEQLPTVERAEIEARIQERVAALNETPPAPEAPREPPAAPAAKKNRK